MDAAMSISFYHQPETIEGSPSEPRCLGMDFQSSTVVPGYWKRVPKEAPFQKHTPAYRVLASTQTTLTFGGVAVLLWSAS